MIGAGILDGDLVIVQRAQDARNGEIVVALVGDDESADEATVKTFYRETGRIRLQPENAALEPIYADHVADPRPRRGSVQGALMDASERDAARPHARPGARRAPARRFARVPGLRRVRHARPGRRRVLPRVRKPARRAALAEAPRSSGALEFGAQAG